MPTSRTVTDLDDEFGRAVDPPQRKAQEAHRSLCGSIRLGTLLNYNTPTRIFQSKVKLGHFVSIVGVQSSFNELVNVLEKRG